MQAKSMSDLSDEDRRDDSAVLELLVGDDHPIWSVVISFLLQESLRTHPDGKSGQDSGHISGHLKA
jgi:hypothetical protein